MRDDGDLDQGRDLGQGRGTGGSSISPSAAAPSTQDFKWLGAGPSPSQPLCGSLDNPKAGRLSGTWTGRDLAPVHQPHLLLRHLSVLLSLPLKLLPDVSRGVTGCHNFS